MKINVAGRIFDSEEIREMSIKEEQKKVFVTTTEDFFRISYRQKQDIEDVYFWLQMSDLTTKDVHHAMYILSMVCDYFINQKEQCNDCPLKTNNTCLLMTIPNNWRN